MNQLKLLISIVDEAEALEAVKGGADIIDVKNPAEGALGASFPWVIQKIRQAVATQVEVSCTIGDAPNLPATVSLAALGAATLDVDYVKVGLYGLKTSEEAVYLLKNSVKAVKNFNPNIKVVATGYADAQKIGCLNSALVPQVAYEAGADFAMIDTAVKHGTALFRFLSQTQLKLFVNKTHDYGLKVALAGSLTKQDLPKIISLGADVVGLRGAVCTDGNRIQGRVTREKVSEIAETLKSLA